MNKRNRNKTKINKTVEIVFSISVILISLAVYYYYFVLADREIVFLYNHLGFEAFDRITEGRYWILGLELGGFISVLYFILKLFLKKISFKRIAKIFIVPLIVGVIVITMNFGTPVMPFVIALSSAFALNFALILGFSVVDDVFENFKKTLANLSISMGIIPLFLLSVIWVLATRENINLAAHKTIIITIIASFISFVWLMTAQILNRSQDISIFRIVKLAAACFYIGLPMIHYLIATPKGYPYISSADNFFADSYLFRILNWLFILIEVFLAKWLFESYLKAIKKKN